MKLSLIIAVCAGLLLSGAAQSDEIRLNQYFSGNEHLTMVDTNGDMIYAAAGDFQVRGNLGRAVTHSITEFTDFMPYGVAGCELRAVLVFQNFVETFSDGSMLFFMTTEGFNCINTTTGDVGGELKGIFLGGTGRFEGATGTWKLYYDAYPFSLGMTAFTGRVRGKVEVPYGFDDDDSDSDSD